MYVRQSGICAYETPFRVYLENPLHGIFINNSIFFFRLVDSLFEAFPDRYVPDICCDSLDISCLIKDRVKAVLKDILSKSPFKSNRLVCFDDRLYFFLGIFDLVISDSMNKFGLMLSESGVAFKYFFYRHRIRSKIPINFCGTR